MRLFRKKQVSASYSKSDVLAARIAGRIIRTQIQIADYLNRKTQYWNRSSKIILLLVFCILFGTLCLYLLIHSFHHLTQ
jgi:hypothetical protein